MSVMRDDIRSVRYTAVSKNEWKFIVEWIDEYKTIVSTQDRKKLDHELPDDFVLRALKKNKMKFYISNQSVIRSRRMSIFDKAVLASDIFTQYGGEIIEEILERGSAVSSLKKN
jgi:hypothetical protein